MPRSLRFVAVAAALVAAFALGQSTNAYALGVQAGFSSSPDQFVAGINMSFLDIIPRIELMPSADVGLGDDTLFSLNADGHFLFKGGDRFKPYVGAGWSGNWVNDDFGSGINVIGGTKIGGKLFGEVKVGLADEIPDFKIMGGLAF